MSQNNHSTPCKNKLTAKKIGLITSWLVTAVITVHWITLAAMAAWCEPATDLTPETQKTAAVHTRASVQALHRATQYLTLIDRAMAEGIPILKANQIPQLLAHSQVFKSLLDHGRAQFGHSVFEPLGKCSAAGIFANSWWQARVSAARQGVTASIPGSIQSQLDEYKTNRDECLRLANPLKVAPENKTIQTARKAL
jgi:hypothetical protein